MSAHARPCLLRVWPTCFVESVQGVEAPRNLQAFMFAAEDAMMPFQPPEKRGPRDSWSLQPWHMTDTVRKVS